MIATLVQDGNLENRISAVQHQGLNMPMAADIVTRLAFNLASLHDEIGMCHRNIHPGNVLCADDDYFLIDFRFSTAANEAAKVTKSAMAHYGKLITLHHASLFVLFVLSLSLSTISITVDACAMQCLMMSNSLNIRVTL